MRPYVLAFGTSWQTRTLADHRSAGHQSGAGPGQPLRNVGRIRQVLVKRRARMLALWLTASVLAVGLPFFVGFYAQRRDPDNWHLADSAAMLSSTTAGVVFFVLAWIIGRRGQRRARAAADAELITSMGALAMSSARSFAGHDHQALRIAADARAALKHYPSASSDDYPRASRDEDDSRERGDKQGMLTEKIIDCYSNLAFGTFSRADALPRSVWTELEDGANDLIEETTSMIAGFGRRRHAQREALTTMLAHIRFVHAIGKRVREQGRTPVKPGQPIVLGDPKATTDQTRMPDQTPKERIERLARLYKRELTVVKQWEVLVNNAGRIDCGIVLCDVADADGWYSPWYVTRDDDGRLKPVNVAGGGLGNEPARLDELMDIPDLPTYPAALQHGQVPQGMRTQAIANLRALLGGRPPVTVCVLAYDVFQGDDKPKRFVLDGNHRLAAARAIAREAQERSGADTNVRVLAFVITENKAVNLVNEKDPYVESSDKDHKAWSWLGFTPDIGLMRYGVAACPATDGRRSRELYEALLAEVAKEENIHRTGSPLLPPDEAVGNHPESNA